MAPASQIPLHTAQYRDHQQGSHLAVPSRLRRHSLVNQSTSDGSDLFFHKAAKSSGCKSYELHKKIRGRAIDKTAQVEYRDRRKNQDWNFIFPPSVYHKQCNAAAVKEILNCSCKVCERFDVDLSQDDSLIFEIENDTEVRFSVAVLAYMGAGFAIRTLKSCGLGQSGFNLSTHFRSSSLQTKLFGPLQAIPESFHNTVQNIQQMASTFENAYEETRRLLRSPKFQANMTTTELQGCNLPFLGESSLNSEEPRKNPHVSTFIIHEEYRDESIPTGQLVRKRLRMNESAGDEKNILNFIAGLNCPNIIRLCSWFVYENDISLVFPRYPGTLEDVLLEKWSPSRRSQFSSKFRGSQLNHWLWEEAIALLEAVKYIHDPKSYGGEKVIMAHFDLKPANILVDEEGHLVITDFGIARIKTLATGDTTRLMGGAGTLTYAPPEGDRTIDPRLSRAYDIWSMGCILLEIILFVKYDKSPKNLPNEIKLFAGERVAEVAQRAVQNQAFWVEDSKGKHVSLKSCVDKRLRALESPDDTYMKKAGKEIRNFMLNPTATIRHTAEQCFDVLKGDDHSMFGKGLVISGMRTIAVGENTSFPISRMSVFFDSKDPDKLSQPSMDCEVRFFLNQTGNDRTNKLQVTMKYEQDGCKKEYSDCGYQHDEELVPISSYINPKISGTAFQFRLTTIHPWISFKLKDERNFFRIQAALTRQQVRIPKEGFSTIPIKRCWFTEWSRIGIGASTKLKVPGCVQIWDQLSEEEYRDSIIAGNRRTSNTSKPPQDTAPKQSAQANPTRIAIFLCSDPAQKHDVTLITFNMAYQTHNLGSEHICKDRNISDPGDFQACVTFLPHYSSLDAHCFREVSNGDIAGTSINISPGIPLDPLMLHNKERDKKVLKKLEWLELEFDTKKDRGNFEARVNQNRLEPYDRP